MVFENLPHENSKPETYYALNSILGVDPVYKITSGAIKSMSQEEIYAMFKKSYSTVLSSIFNGGNYEILRIIIDNKDILFAFVNTISSVSLTPIEKTYFTRLTYDYNNSKTEKSPEIQGILINTCRILYRGPIARLINYVPEAVAVDMCIARWGHNQELKNVKRLNNVILSTPDMSTQKVVDIYGTLFTRMTSLFIGTMFDIKDTTGNVYKQEVDSMISNAILYLLDNMASEDINKVLCEYAEVIKVTKKYPRISLHSISFDEFPRVVSAVKELQTIDKYVY